MARTYNKFRYGIGLVPKGSTESNTKGEFEFLTSTNKLYVHNGSVNDPVVTETVAATLTNKTLTAPVIATIVNTGTLTLPSSTDTLVGRATTDTLTNKTISGSNNTLSNIANGSLTNSSLTINGQSVSLGGSVTVTASTTETLTIGTGLSGGSFNGSTPVTITIDSSVVTLTGSQSLSSKTLTSPVINTATADTITGIAGGALTLASASGQNILLNPEGATTATLSTSGLTLASAKTLVFTNNGQTVTFGASASASASYSITAPAAAPTANTALVYNGSAYVWSFAGGWTTGSSTSLGAGGTVSISTSIGQQLFTVASSGGAVTLSSTPFGSGAPLDGTTIRLIGTSNTNTVSLVNNDAAKGCILNGAATLFQYSVIELQYSSTLDRYIETFRNI